MDKMFLVIREKMKEREADISGFPSLDDAISDWLKDNENAHIVKLTITSYRIRDYNDERKFLQTDMIQEKDIWKRAYELK